MSMKLSLPLCFLALLALPSWADEANDSLDDLIQQSQNASAQYASSTAISQLTLPNLDWTGGRVGNFNPQAYLPGALVGVYAVDLTNNRVVLSYNANLNFKPASTNKVITALLTALTFDFNSRLYTNAYLNGSNLTLEFTGDPSFNLASVNNLISQLKGNGVTQINTLTINTGKYTGHNRPQGWVWNGNSMCYSSENSAAQYNYNCITGTLDTSKAVGTIAPMKNVSNANVISINSQVRIVSRNQSTSCELNYSNPQNTSFTLTGCSSQSRDGIWMYFAVPNGDLFTGNVIRQALTNAGIKVSNLKFEQTLISSDRTPSFSIPSATIGDLVKTMLTKSENHIAEQLYRNIALKRTGQPVSYTLANQVNSQLLTSLGLEVDPSIYDGSGLSYYNNVTPVQMTKIMSAIYTNNASLSNLLTLFPQQNEGTLALRTSYKNYSLIGKTGSLNGVSNFTGILTTSKGHKIAFTYFINNLVSNNAHLVNFENQLLEFLNKQ
ncbi:D-alanyl-D-alanine carboxypeptidase/D-alanyl-D-alanine-endopeptidase [Psittacicella melopsittaci]|uniref:D-alanyl-D-alanine carboxypeptidase/D-alanyl-D-alanine-endopeptidase n=1 Tax=Psittacicella melopsittaci TaxID=2028576 RepID=A0A3A1Y5A7_9GAMM|nr:D-alanyl-D-alanine carboxypeptidase/D-alanyl-D-alanine-endopeptidase [Psittacicella melopsittaci]RIY33462.1 D-alanyl-D-alanine carboxypeptidase/D-alanyl-D-alanine-endopeptidase [Psittacicella melopsittaci]